MKHAEFINNIDLIENNLLHIDYELRQEIPSYFRIAVESHNALLRSMVQALKDGSNFCIDKKLDRDRKFTFSINNNPPIMIKKEKVVDCLHAWRFSKPVELNKNDCDKGIRGNDNYKKFLIGFYDLLAMIQCDYFMKYFSQAETIIITDDDLEWIDWLHEEIRN